MFIDAQNEFSTDQAVTASAVSENVIDAGKNAGAGQPLRIHCMVSTDFDDAGTSLQVGLRSADSAAGVAAGTEHWVGPAVLAASLKQGYVFNLPPLPDTHERYVGLYYTVAGGPFGAGKVDAALVLERQTNGSQIAVDTAS
ncbi:MAG: Bbp16 family capsid cement protein [Desulfovibrionaceae bacterium]